MLSALECHNKATEEKPFFLRRTHSYRAHCWRCSDCDQAGLRMSSVWPLLRFLPISPLIPGPVGSTQSALTNLHTLIIICPTFFLLFHLPSAFVLPSLYSFPLPPPCPCSPVEGRSQREHIQKGGCCAWNFLEA